VVGRDVVGVVQVKPSRSITALDNIGPGRNGKSAAT